MENFVGKDEYYNHIANRIGMQMPNPGDVIRREDFPDDDSYVTALARRELEIEENPRLSELKRKHYVELARQREEEQKAAEKRQYEEARAAAKLTEKEKQEVAAEALDAATADLRSGRITHEEFEETKEKYRAKIEGRRLDNKTTGAFFNKWCRQELQRNTLIKPDTNPQQ